MLECTTYTEPSPAPTKARGNSVTPLAELDSAFFLFWVFTKGFIKMLVKSFPFETVSKQ